MKLLLGLDQDVPPTQCACGRSHSTDGAHQLCCSKHASKGWNRGHDLVVSAIRKETERLGLPGTDNKQTLSRKYKHAAGNDVADAYIDGMGKITVKDQVPRHAQEHNEFLFDVTIDAVVQMDGKWQGHFNANGQWEDTALQSFERAKYRKHEEAYANISLGFLAFALSCFCVLGNNLVQYLWVLARLETQLESLVDLHTRQGLRPLTDEEVGQVRGRCFSASLARIGHAASKATAMRLAGTPCLPVLHPPQERPPSVPFLDRLMWAGNRATLWLSRSCRISYPTILPILSPYQ